MLNSLLKNPKALRVGLIGLWSATLLSCLVVLFIYSKTPGLNADLKGTIWPAASALSDPGEGVSRFVVFLHPKCPCSRATLAELERLLPVLLPTTKVSVLFIRPQGRSEAWVQDSLWRAAKRLPDVEVEMDPNGKEAQIFGAKTSGQTFLFDEAGKLIFEGGITPARGHEGDSLGRSIVMAWSKKKLREPASMTVQMSHVYGCALRSARDGKGVQVRD